MRNGLKQIAKKVTLELIYELLEEKFTRLEEQIQEVKQELKENIRKVETELKEDLHKVENEIHELRADSRSMNARMDQLHMRLDKLIDQK